MRVQRIALFGTASKANSPSQALTHPHLRMTRTHSPLYPISVLSNLFGMSSPLLNPLSSSPIEGYPRLPLVRWEAASLIKGSPIIQRLKIPPQAQAPQAINPLLRRNSAHHRRPTVKWQKSGKLIPSYIRATRSQDRKPLPIKGLGMQAFKHAFKKSQKVGRLLNMAFSRIAKDKSHGRGLFTLCRRDQVLYSQSTEYGKHLQA